jgi:deazaflavin-dependent oxidoreductase (nitroreductase family)
MSTQMRFLKLLGESSFWKTVGRLHVRLYHMTGGRIGHQTGDIKNLLLTTTGRKTGESRTVPLAYLRDGESYVIVASNGGSDRAPSWWLNLKDEPRARVQVGNETLEVVAARASSQEHARLWPMLKEMNPFYGRYEQITPRKIPVVILRPAR